MNLKILCVLFCALVFLVSALTIGATNIKNIISTTSINTGSGGGVTLITEYNLGGVIEVDNAGNIIWEKTGLNEPVDTERLENGNTLITEQGANRVIEVDNTGNIIWEKTGLNEPIDTERLENGNTLITEQGANRVLEVDTSGNVVWEKMGLQNPYDAERLDNGNTLITEYSAGRVLEIDSSGNIHWQKSGLSLPCDAERLDNGNTLIVEFGHDRVIEVDTAGVIVWEISWLDGPIDAERIQVPDEPPSTPTIDGPTSGEIDKTLDFTFTSTDPDGDEIEYYIDWGDGNKEWTNFYASGTPVTVSHTWDKRDTYTIMAKAVDPYGEESNWATHVITIPRTRIIIHSSFMNIIEQQFEKSPISFSILRYIFGA